MKYNYFNKYGYGFDANNLYRYDIPTLKAMLAAMKRDKIVVNAVTLIVLGLTFVPFIEVVTRGLPFYMAVIMTATMIVANFYVNGARTSIVNGIADVAKMVDNYYILTDVRANHLNPEKHIPNPFSARYNQFR